MFLSSHKALTYSLTFVVLLVLCIAFLAENLYSAPIRFNHADLDFDVPLPVEDFQPLLHQSAGELPSEWRLDVPFSPQAPLADWRHPFDEACEETSLIMIDRFYRGEGIEAHEITPKIRSLVEWELRRGYAVDITAQETADIAGLYFDRRSQVYTDEDVSIETMQRLLVAGYPVIVPVDGRSLQNPHFRGDRLFYHMIVLTGYDDTGFFANDPGTQFGEQYHYRYDILMNSLHDWTRDEKPLEEGPRVIAVLEKEPYQQLVEAEE